ncbi:MAG: hypothetical protein SOU16_04265 [Faecalimonas sp.]|nr:hypothetical protein [Faecalimonas sp.]
MLEYMGEKSYKKAAEIADSIDWRKVKNAAMLCGASEVYEYNGEYEKSREILFLAYDRAPGSRKIVYRLGTLALKMNDIRESVDCYEEFVAMAPKDPNQYILRYKILKSQKAPLNQQIEALEDFKKAEYVEKWAYELAKLYDAAGMLTECLEECDDLILWFSEGKYVYQAMELKMKYKPLTPLQQEKYIHRNDKPTPAKRKKEPIAEKSEEIAEKKEYVEEEKKAEPFEEEEQEVTSEPKEEKEALEMKEAEEVALEEKEEPKEEEAVLEMKEELREEELILEAEEGTKKEKCTSEIEKEPEEKGTVSETKEESEEKETSSSEEEIDEQMKKEIFSQTTKMSVEEILQNWEEKQKENAQIIQEEQEKARAERERQEAKKVEEVESILPDDIRQLMEELEAEAVEIRTNKNRRERTEQVFERKSEIESVEEIPQEQEEEMEEPEEDPFDEESFNEEAFEEVEADGFEEIEEIEESEGIKLGDTQAIAISAKALMNDTVVEEPIEKVQELRTESPTSPFDTGFIVQGRYDLDVQSEIGIKAGLTEEQKKLFSYFVPVHGMSEQIVDVLENDKKCKTRYGTSRTANLLVVGRKGSGKTVLAVDIVKAIQKNRKLKQGKVAIVTAESLNKKDVSQIIEKLHGGAIIIERASQMNKKTVAQLNDLMEEQTGELLVVLEEERRPLDKMLSAYPAFKKKFTSRLELPVFTNDELVTFGQTYAKENGYKIDEMGILALYSRIDLMQREESVVTVADVKEIVDEAIEHSQRKNFKRFIKKLFKKGKEETSRIILQEQDFR